LKFNKVLQVLDLASTVDVVDLILIGNQIGVKGAEAIAEALKVNEVLEILNLSCIVICVFLPL
jgi:hypothetical protein